MLSQKKILIIEDLDENRDFVEKVLENDFQLLFASDGRMGITLAKMKRPDLILMDLNLPILDGWEATRILRSDKSFSDIPILALTAYSQEADYNRAMEAGCTEFLSKPIMPDELRSVVNKYLNC